MSGLKIFVDLMSQPSRAVALFAKITKIPHEVQYVMVKKGEHVDPDYVDKVNRFGKVPAIIDNGNNIVESVAILRYLSRKYKVADHWYPKDLLAQSKVDEFLEWQHIGLRVPLSMYFQTKFIIPLLSGTPAKLAMVDTWKSRMENSLNDLETIWLKNNKYLAGDKISIADIIGICEVEQPRMAGYDPLEGRPNITNWVERVRQDLQPHYKEVTSVMEFVITKFKGEPPSSLSKL